jgi:thioredoxin 1
MKSVARRSRKPEDLRNITRIGNQRKLRRAGDIPIWNKPCRVDNSLRHAREGKEISMAESNGIHNVTDKDFESSVLNGGKPAHVDFWAPWCGPCRIIGPIVEELAPSYKDRAIIAKMNVDDNPEVAQRYGVTSIPTLIMFKDGKIADRAVGAMPKGELQKFIDRNL